MLDSIIQTYQRVYSTSFLVRSPDHMHSQQPCVPWRPSCAWTWSGWVHWTQRLDYPSTDMQATCLQNHAWDSVCNVVWCNKLRYRPSANIACGHPPTRCGKKSSPLKFFTVFSATVWNLNFKLYTFIFWTVLHLTAKWNVIVLKNDKVIDFLTSPPTDFSALKNVQATTPIQ